MENFKIDQTKNIIPQQDNKESLITKYLKAISNLRKQETDIIKQIKSAENNTEKQIIEADLEDTQKRIAEYEISINNYRKTTKNNHLTNIAGKEAVAEVIDFKKRQKAKIDNPVKEDFNSEIGSDFLSDFNNFTERKRQG